MAKYNIAISLGCTNTLIIKSGVGVVLNEPTLLLINPKNIKDDVVAVGNDVFSNQHKNADYQIVSPVNGGTITNKEYAKKMLTKYLEKLNERKFFRGNLLWLTPTSISDNDKNEFINLGYGLGFKNVAVCPSVIAAFQELEVDETNKRAHMLVDIGGGTTNVSVVLKGKIMQGCTMDFGGNDLDFSVMNYIKNAFNVEVNQFYAKKIKENINSVLPNDTLGCSVVLPDETGVGNELQLTARELRNVYIPYFMDVCACISNVLNLCSNDIVSDIKKTGIYLCGGVANITGLDKFIQGKIGVTVYLVERPEFTSAFGAEKILNEPEKLDNLIELNL